jgi:flagellar FliJ protein
MNRQDNSTLELLLEREQSELDAAALALHQAESHLARVEAQVAQFQTYRAEYVGRWQAEFQQQQGGAEILHCYRGFSRRLDEALNQLATQQMQAQATARRRRAVLLETQTRVAAIRKLIERRREAQALLEQRREQKHTDDFAQRANRPGPMTRPVAGLAR